MVVFDWFQYLECELLNTFTLCIAVCAKNDIKQLNGTGKEEQLLWEEKKSIPLKKEEINYFGERKEIKTITFEKKSDSSNLLWSDNNTNSYLEQKQS